jgi:hypothetical protein
MGSTGPAAALSRNGGKAVVAWFVGDVGLSGDSQVQVNVGRIARSG